MEILIKRHANRCFYDTDQSQQVTLDEIAKRIREGHRIKVVDHATSQDITLATLAQILMHNAGQLRKLPEVSQVLLEIIQKKGGNMLELAKNAMLAGLGAAYLTKEKAEEIVNELIAKGQVTKEDRAKKVRELMEKAEAKVKEFSGLVEAQVKKTVGAMTSTDRQEIRQLRKQVEELKEQVAKLKAQKG